MLHAVIRWEHDALHFFGDVTSYNLQTLRLHVRDRARNGGVPAVRFEVDAEDRPRFVKHMSSWLAELRGVASPLEVVVGGVPMPIWDSPGWRSAAGSAAAAPQWFADRCVTRA